MTPPRLCQRKAHNDAHRPGLADLRQCILYDGPGPSARLIGIEYMISARLYDTLDPAERRLWHSHVYEVRSGMLAMPGPTAWPARHAWDAAVTREMRQVVLLYGKVYHLWQTDRGDQLPLGEPQLMTSLVGPTPSFDFEARVGERDARLGTDWRRSKELRQDIEAPDVHPDADQAWKKRNGTE